MTSDARKMNWPIISQSIIDLQGESTAKQIFQHLIEAQNGSGWNLPFEALVKDLIQFVALGYLEIDLKDNTYSVIVNHKVPTTEEEMLADWTIHEPEIIPEEEEPTPPKKRKRAVEGHTKTLRSSASKTPEKKEEPKDEKIKTRSASKDKKDKRDKTSKLRSSQDKKEDKKVKKSKKKDKTSKTRSSQENTTALPASNSQIPLQNGSKVSVTAKQRASTDGSDLQALIGINPLTGSLIAQQTGIFKLMLGVEDTVFTVLSTRKEEKKKRRASFDDDFVKEEPRKKRPKTPTKTTPKPKKELQTIIQPIPALFATFEEEEEVAAAEEAAATEEPAPPSPMDCDEEENED